MFNTTKWKTLLTTLFIANLLLTHHGLAEERVVTLSSFTDDEFACVEVVEDDRVVGIACIEDQGDEEIELFEADNDILSAMEWHATIEMPVSTLLQTDEETLALALFPLATSETEEFGLNGPSFVNVSYLVGTSKGSRQTTNYGLGKLFTKIGKWVKGLFGKKKPKSPELPPVPKGACKGPDGTIWCQSIKGPDGEVIGFYDVLGDKIVPKH